MRLILSTVSLPTLCLVAAPFTACQPEVEPEADDPVVSIFAGVAVDTIVDEQDGLDGPRDLDFNPEVAGELWIINRTDDGTVTVSDVGTDAQQARYRKDPFALHFMEETSSMSFASGNKFGSCGETRNTYDGQAEPNDFMGPALWSASDEIFAVTNPEAVADNDGFDLGSHLDMMHETPLCMGIAWVDTGVGDNNVYFVFEGLTNTIARYDFKSDHGPGFDDHTDGTVERFIDVDVKRVADIPSHMVVDQDSGLLYVADTGNKRVGVLDASKSLLVNVFDGFETEVQELERAKWTAMAFSDGITLDAPSGIALKDGVLYVGDNATSKVHAFDLDGRWLDTLDLSADIAAGGLMGIRVNPEGDSLYVVDFEASRVLRVKGLNMPG